jgi:hypothetical protein
LGKIYPLLYERQKSWGRSIPFYRFAERDDHPTQFASRKYGPWSGSVGVFFGKLTGHGSDHQNRLLEWGDCHFSKVTTICFAPSRVRFGALPFERLPIQAFSFQALAYVSESHPLLLMMCAYTLPPCPALAVKSGRLAFLSAEVGDAVFVFVNAARTKGAGGCTIMRIMHCPNLLSYLFSSDPFRPHTPLSSGADFTP